jgi:hypothetical protein
MQPTVHRASKSYNVHHIKDIHIQHEYERENDDVIKLALGATLGVFDHPETTIEDLLESSSNDQEAIQELIEDDTIGDDQREELRQKYSHLFEEDEASKVIDRVEELVDDDDWYLTQTHLNYLEMLENTKTDDASDLVNEFSITEQNYNGMINGYGFDNIRLTSDFPILTAVYGYSRTYENPDTGEYPRLRAFPQKEDGVPIYATKTSTEAALFRLDPLQVARWLAENNLLHREEKAEETDSPKSELGQSINPDTLDRTEARALLYNIISSVEPYDDISEYDGPTKYLHGLLHTISHELLKEAALLSGIERTSLAEFLFPETLTIAIYSNQTESFTIGGLYTLVERNLEDWLASAVDETKHCLYDPVCAEQGGTCHACTHISEIGCQHFNQNLSRGYLFADANRKEELKGFWELTDGPE